MGSPAEFPLPPSQAQVWPTPLPLTLECAGFSFPWPHKVLVETDKNERDSSPEHSRGQIAATSPQRDFDGLKRQLWWPVSDPCGTCPWMDHLEKAKRSFPWSLELLALSALPSWIPYRKESAQLFPAALPTLGSEQEVSSLKTRGSRAVVMQWRRLWAGPTWSLGSGLT